MAAGQGKRAYDVTFAASAGTITIFPTAVIMWNIGQLTVEIVEVDPVNNPTPGGATCFMRLNGSLVTPLIPTSDAAGGDPSVLLTPSDRITVTWANVNTGDAGRAFILYDEVPYS